MIKFTKLALLLSMLVLGVACSELEEYNPTIDKPSTDNGNNDYNTDKEKVSIVGSWQSISYYASKDGKVSYTTTLQFKQDGSGSYNFRYPSWENDEKLVYKEMSTSFTYQYEYGLGILTINSPETDACFSALIISENGSNALHINGSQVMFEGAMLEGVYKQLQ